MSDPANTDYYDIRILLDKVWQPTKNCLRNNIFSALPPYDAEQFSQIQGTSDNYLKGYLIKRKYQLILSQILQLVMIVLTLKDLIIDINQTSRVDYILTSKTIVSLLVIDFSILFIKIIEWIILFIALYNWNSTKTLTYSHIALFSLFIVRLLYLFLPYNDILQFEFTKNLNPFAKELASIYLVVRVYSISVIPMFFVNLFLLRAAKKATYYLMLNYDNATRNNYFYQLHFIITWIYVPTVSIFYGIAYIVVHYLVLIDTVHSLGFDGYVKEEYVPILWMIWFLSAMFELVPKKWQCSCLADILAMMCNIMWWVVVVIILHYLKLLDNASVIFVKGYAQYFQLKLQLRDFFVAVEYRNRDSERVPIVEMSQISEGESDIRINTTQYQPVI